MPLISYLHEYLFLQGIHFKMFLQAGELLLSETADKFSGGHRQWALQERLVDLYNSPMVLLLFVHY